MSIHKSIEISKILLVLPFVLHEPTVRQLKNKSQKRSLEEFIIKNINCVMNFNSRFEDYLPLTVNSLTILKEAGLVTIGRFYVSFNDADEQSENALMSKRLGTRAQDIFKANEFLSELMKIEKVNSFYLKLRVAL